MPVDRRFALPVAGTSLVRLFVSTTITLIDNYFFSPLYLFVTGAGFSQNI